MKPLHELALEEQKAIASIRHTISRLSKEGRDFVARDVSFIRRNILYFLLGTFAVANLLGALTGY